MATADAATAAEEDATDEEVAWDPVAPELGMAPVDDAGEPTFAGDALRDLPIKL